MALDHPDDALPLGYRLGDYEILRVLGRGGFGFTYQARRAGVAGDMVAIKELFPASTAQRAANQEVVALPQSDPDDIHHASDMFIREAKLICSLQHPHIVQGLDAFRANGTAYLVMRYVSGRNLRDSLRDPTGFRPSPRTLPIRFGQLLDALETLHGHNLLHCDIKPDNIFLGIDHEPILIDLGSARWHVPDVGTEYSSTYSHYFSAIEQVVENFGSIGPWTDIYQLSAVMYRCITGGKLPDAMDRLQAHEDPYVPLVEIPESASYPQALVRSIDHGLALLPQHRPQSVVQWKAAMGASVPKPRRESPVKPPPPPVVSPAHASPPPLPHANQDELGSPQPQPVASSKQPDLLGWVGGILALIIAIIIYLMLNQ